MFLPFLASFYLPLARQVVVYDMHDRLFLLPVYLQTAVTKRKDHSGDRARMKRADIQRLLVTFLCTSPLHTAAAINVPDEM
jgi:fructosamine-3-kinase